MRIATSMPFVGTKMYCPDCSRLLVSFNPDGTFNLAGESGISGKGEGHWKDGAWVEEPEILVYEAYCYRRPCRLKRWLRAHKPRRK